MYSCNASTFMYCASGFKNSDATDEYPLFPISLISEIFRAIARTCTTQPNGQTIRSKPFIPVCVTDESGLCYTECIDSPAHQLPNPEYPNDDSLLTSVGNTGGIRDNPRSFRAFVQTGYRQWVNLAIARCNESRQALQPTFGMPNLPFIIQSL